MIENVLYVLPLIRAYFRYVYDTSFYLEVQIDELKIWSTV